MCNRYEFQDWTAFAAGDAAFWQSRRMARHLLQCADCRAAYNSVKTIWNAVQPFATDAVNPAMRSQIQSSIALETAPRASRSRASARLPRLPRAAVFGTLGLTAALALCAAPFLMTRPTARLRRRETRYACRKDRSLSRGLFHGFRERAPRSNRGIEQSNALRSGGVRVLGRHA